MQYDLRAVHYNGILLRFEDERGSVIINFYFKRNLIFNVFKI